MTELAQFVQVAALLRRRQKRCPCKWYGVGLHLELLKTQESTGEHAN